MIIHLHIPRTKNRNVVSLKIQGIHVSLEQKMLALEVEEEEFKVEYSFIDEHGYEFGKNVWLEKELHYIVPEKEEYEKKEKEARAKEAEVKAERVAAKVAAKKIEVKEIEAKVEAENKANKAAKLAAIAEAEAIKAEATKEVAVEAQKVSKEKVEEPGAWPVR